MANLKIGELAPDFELPNQNGDLIKLSDYAGQNVLVWFFPRAYGGGWTNEAKGFRDRTQGLSEQNTTPIGITFSLPEELKRWSEDNALTGDLLSDQSRSVAISYGAVETRDQERPKRMSYLLGPDMKILKIYETPEAAIHPAEVLKDLTWYQERLWQTIGLVKWCLTSRNLVLWAVGALIENRF